MAKLVKCHDVSFLLSLVFRLQFSARQLVG